MNAFDSLMKSIRSYRRQTTERLVSTGVVIEFPVNWQELNGRGKGVTTSPRFKLEGLKFAESTIPGSGEGRKFLFFSGEKPGKS